MLNVSEDINPKSSLLYFGHLDNAEVKKDFPAFFLYRHISHLFNTHAMILSAKCECGGLLVRLHDNTTWAMEVIFCSYCGKIPEVCE